MIFIKIPKYSILLIFILLPYYCNCNNEIIDINSLNEITQCFHVEKSAFGEKEEIAYELINDGLHKTVFIQFKSIESIIIHKSDQTPSSIIFSRKKEEGNFGNFYLEIEKEIHKYYIDIKLSQSDLTNFKLCFNAFENKGNSFKKIGDKNIKISSYEVINSGKFLFYINDNKNKNTFNALRINKNHEKYFSLSFFDIKAFVLNSDEVMSLNIYEVYNRGEYKYIIWNFNTNKKIKEILVEVDLNMIDNKNENKKCKLEIELLDSKEIHYEYKLDIKKDENKEISNIVYYINLKKYLYNSDLDILFLTNNLNNEIIISNNYNINNNNISKLDKKFIVINKYLFDNEKYKNIDTELLIIIIDEHFSIKVNEDIFYSFQFSGSSHELYKYKENIQKNEFFNNNNKVIIKNNMCRSSYLINYFTDSETEKIIEYEAIFGNIDLYYTNKNDLSNSINDYFDKINSFPMNDIRNSIMTGDYGIFKINCKNGSGKILSYIYSYNKNGLNDIINFKNQKALLFIEKNKEYSFHFDEKLKEEQFTFRVRILKKDKGKYNSLNLIIDYNDGSYNVLKENNFIELKHEKNNNSPLNISLPNDYVITDDLTNSLILEIIKEINIEKNLIKIQKSNIENSKLNAMNYLFVEYDQKSSTLMKIILKNDDFISNAKICIHKGYGVYPYLIKPICDSDEFLILGKNENLILTYENPYLSSLSDKITIENPLYISIFTDTKITYSLTYEKYSSLNISDGYKDIDVDGQEIIQLEKREDFPAIYYQINICQDFNNNLQDYSLTNPIFSYYFDKKDNSNIINIKSNIYNEYHPESEKPKITFISNGAIKGKFKYTYGEMNKLKYKESFSRKINAEQNKKLLKLSMESPFIGNLTFTVIIINSDFEKYEGYCGLINLYEELIKNKDIIYYGQRFFQKEIQVNESDNLVTMEIESEQILDMNRKNGMVFVINTLKEINIDIFYNPISIYINLRDSYTETKEKQKLKNILFIFIFFVLIVFLYFVYKKCKVKNSNEINYERKRIRLTDGVINESNKLF